jgi:polyphosphate kinase 2 (PPK2 family)
LLETLNLDIKLARAEYEQSLPALQRRLYDLARTCWQHNVSSIVVFEGWDASGKGECISALTQRLDPRGFKMHAINPPRTYEQKYPWLWRFWLKIPNRGEMVIFDRSWYRRVLDARVDGILPPKEWRKTYKDIVDFERTLADDGTAIIKFFLHISKKEQKSRFKKMEADPLESWRVTKDDWRRHKQYEEYKIAVEEMLELTESEFAPWTIVEGTSRWHERKRVFDTIIERLEHRLGDATPPREEFEEAFLRDADLRAVNKTLEQGREGVA